MPDVLPQNRITELRMAANMSSAELARRAALKPDHLGKIERGRIPLTHELMRRIAVALDCKPSELLPDEDMEMRLSDTERQWVENLRAAVRDAIRAASEAVGPRLEGDPAQASRLAEMWAQMTDGQRDRLLEIATSARGMVEDSRPYRGP